MEKKLDQLNLLNNIEKKECIPIDAEKQERKRNREKKKETAGPGW